MPETRRKTRGGKLFRRGNKAAVGNRGGGRPPDDFRQWLRGKFWGDRTALWARAKKLDRDGIKLLGVLKSIAYIDEQAITHTGKVQVECVNDWRTND